MPSYDSGDDFVRVGGPCERLGLDIVLIKEAVDGAWRSAIERNTPVSIAAQ